MWERQVSPTRTLRGSGNSPLAKNVIPFQNINFVIISAQFANKIKIRCTVIVLKHGGGGKEGLSSGSMKYDTLPTPP